MIGKEVITQIIKISGAIGMGMPTKTLEEIKTGVSEISKDIHIRAGTMEIIIWEIKMLGDNKFNKTHGSNHRLIKLISLKQIKTLRKKLQNRYRQKPRNQNKNLQQKKRVRQHQEKNSIRNYASFVSVLSPQC
jgi:hypothetical protein